MVLLREVLKSKIHKAHVTDSNPDYEGSIGIDEELMNKANISPNEKVLVISNETGERLETYVFPEEKESKKISINGGAAKKINEGEEITILVFALVNEDLNPNRVLVNETNEFLKYY